MQISITSNDTFEVIAYCRVNGHLVNTEKMYNSFYFADFIKGLLDGGYYASEIKIRMDGTVNESARAMIENAVNTYLEN